MKSNTIFLIFLIFKGVCSEWLVKYDLTKETFEQEQNLMTSQNYTLTQLCGYSTDARSQLFMAHWERNTVRGKTVYFTQMTKAEFESNVYKFLKPNTFTTFIEYSLVYVCPYVVSDQVYFSAVWEYRSTETYKVQTDANIYSLIMSTVFSRSAYNKFRPTYANSYFVNNEELSVTVFEENNQIEDVSFFSKLTEEEYLKKVSYFEPRGYRLNFLNTYNVNETLYYLASWEKFDLISAQPLEIKHNLNRVEFENHLNELKVNIFKPRYITSFVHNGQVRFNIISQKEKIESLTLSDIDDYILNGLGAIRVHSLALSITKNEKLVYDRVYGRVGPSLYDDLDKKNSLKIASISKLFTSLSIMRLLEEGKISSLEAKVFGPGSILNNKFIYPDYNLENLKKVTVKSLLEHTSGIRSTSFYEPNEYLSLRKPEITNIELIQEMLYEEAFFTVSPDANVFMYSNIGYTILGIVIEQISGMSYENFIRENILAPCQIGSSMYITKPDIPGRDPYYFPHSAYTGESGASAGGWTARSQDLAKMLVRIDGLSMKPDIISSNSLNIMRSNTTVSYNLYGVGMALYPDTNSYGHEGSLTIIGSMAKVYKNNISYALITTPEPDREDQVVFYNNLEKIIDAIDERNLWPNVDLFDTPDTTTPSVTTTPRITTTPGITTTSGSSGIYKKFDFYLISIISSLIFLCLRN